MSKMLAVLVVASMVMACSSASQPVAATPTVPEVTEPAPAPVPVPADPFTIRLDTFGDTYRIMACKANPNYDVDASIATLREPYGWLMEIKDDKMSTTRTAFVELLQKQGYESIEAFVKEKEYIDTAKPTWFETELTGRLLDMVEDCKK